eukprot:2465309-Rhodomonas_salina.1
MSVLCEAQGARKEDMMSGELSLSALLRVYHPEFLADSCSCLDVLGTCYRLTMGQLRHRLGMPVCRTHARSIVLHFNLLSDPPIYIGGEIALAARKAKSDPVNVMF